MSRSDYPAIQSSQPTLPAGGLASPPTDPPPASAKPLQGQQETNQPLDECDQSDSPSDPTHAEMNDEDDALWRAAAMALGRTSCFRHGGEQIQFDQAEDEIAREWDARQTASQQRVSWQQARELARDAWDQARAALTSGEAKPSAR